MSSTIFDFKRYVFEATCAESIFSIPKILDYLDERGKLNSPQELGAFFMAIGDLCEGEYLTITLEGELRVNNNLSQVDITSALLGAPSNALPQKDLMKVLKIHPTNRIGMSIFFKLLYIMLDTKQIEITEAEETGEDMWRSLVEV